MEERRVTPEPDRYAICAREDESIKEYYKGVFEEVYIFFHPFIKPVTMDADLFYGDEIVDKHQMIHHCEKVSWKQFMDLSGLNSYDEIDIGLRTRILGLKKELQDQKLAKVIDTTCEQHHLIPPDEGFLPDLIINDLLAAIKKESYDWIWVGNEFCTERKLEYIDDLISQDILSRHNLFTHDQSILITTHWDSHFSMICSDSKEKLENIIQTCSLEGFYCDEKTEIYWSVRNGSK
ncbi:DUF2711 family protein [Mesobacillus selenatarsenatis]|uniref:DUF2711 family protein n=1 Tax=Mesobacillus selenatarsenatis TaxID=388741 RepID=A0A846TAU6_9BACI|nr:DUF2711 family protein [Mesobacillus selenatarsenatis]NKE03980.1 DUF2711 family protein [Mesobacillus selenatarsenatis]